MSKQISELLDFAEKIYPLQSIVRYNNLQKVRSESVIEHIGFVSMITLELNKYFDFNLGKALSMALCHDKAEIYVTDVPHNVKQRFPKLNELIKECEHDAALLFDKQTAELISEYDEGYTLESKMVKIADIISCIQYSSNEIKFGHNDNMQKVYDESMTRLKQILEGLGRCL